MRPKLYMPKKGEVAKLPESAYDPHKNSYKEIDSREGRLKDLSTDRGTFRIKENHKDG
jgi:hypothetical protein